MLNRPRISPMSETRQPSIETNYIRQPFFKGRRNKHTIGELKRLTVVWGWKDSKSIYAGKSSTLRGPPSTRNNPKKK